MVPSAGTIKRQIPEKMLNSNGSPMNPFARDFPNEFIQTGISTIDVLNPLVRGQKLPIFSGAGLPHARLAAQVARQAKVLKTGEALQVFAAMAPPGESDFSSTTSARAINRAVLLINSTSRRSKGSRCRAWP
jgi:V/A-type H+-transporting ATPase subunit B